MAENRTTESTPQFSTAEYRGTPGSDRCNSCNQSLTQTYYRLNGHAVCSNCVEHLKQQLPEDSHQAYMSGLLFGAGAAILGLILYAAFGIITGLEIGYISLAVGWLVGKAISKGSKGVGGRRYQITAVVLTYAAVSLAAIPIDISQARNERKPAQVERSTQPSGGQSSSADSDLAKDDQGASSDSKMSFGRAIGLLVLIGLASPFLALQDPVHGLIGLVILVVGIRIAWQMTGRPRLNLLGPFNLGDSRPAAIR
jgi:hypothetical protein